MLSEKTWRGEIVMLFIAAQFLCFSFGLAVIAMLHKLGVGGFRHDGDFGNVLLATLSFQGATWFLIPFFLRQNEIQLGDAFGLRGKNLKRSLSLASAVAIAILPVAWLLQGASVAVLEKFGVQVDEQAAVQLLSDSKSIGMTIYLGVFAVVIAPVAEEFIFRGVLFPFVRQLGFPKSAWFGVSALFALIHLDAGTFVPLFVLALALAWLYQKTGSLLAPVFAHGLFNAVNLAVLCYNQ